MNCRTAREKITESFAGEAVLPREAFVHRENCAECGAFYERESKLFESMKESLESLVNRPVPAFLLPRVRAEFDELPGRRALWAPGWSFAAVAAGVVLALTLVFVWRHPAQHSAVADLAVPRLGEAPSRIDEAPASGGETLVARNEMPDKKVEPRGSEAAVYPHRLKPVAPEVIVLAEEREAFARFLAGRPDLNVKTVALTHAAAQQDDVPAEIALLEIKDVDVKPLESLNGK
jgi:hypothetical protein